MSAKFVRGTYGVPAKVGMVVTVDGMRGRIVSFPGQSLGVRFDSQPHITRRCHPTWHVIYHTRGTNGDRT